jgi:hypothetical protein
MMAAITDRELRPGRRFTATHKKMPYVAEVMEDGTISVSTARGKQVATGLRSMSKAGSTITRYPVNGWVFWQEMEAKPKAKAAPKPKAKAAKKAAPAPEAPAQPTESPPAEEAQAS